ncbi:MAG: DUF485 domain-containing protein [Ktedonobacteraceae bacterium]
MDDILPDPAKGILISSVIDFTIGGFPMSEQALPRDNQSPIRRTTPVANQAHQMTGPEWQAIERDPDFQELVREKRNFIIPATIFFIVYYFTLPILVGYFPDMMDTKVVGNINIAYLFALSEFVIAWIVMWLYVRRAGVFDGMASRIIAKVKGGNA